MLHIYTILILTTAAAQCVHVTAEQQHRQNDRHRTAVWSSLTRSDRRDDRHSEVGGSRNHDAQWEDQQQEAGDFLTVVEDHSNPRRTATDTGRGGALGGYDVSGIDGGVSSTSGSSSTSTSTSSGGGGGGRLARWQEIEDRTVCVGQRLLVDLTEDNNCRTRRTRLDAVDESGTIVPWPQWLTYNTTALHLSGVAASSDAGTTIIKISHICDSDTFRSRFDYFTITVYHLYKFVNSGDLQKMSSTTVRTCPAQSPVTLALVKLNIRCCPDSADKAGVINSTATHVGVPADHVYFVRKNFMARLNTTVILQSPRQHMVYECGLMFKIGCGDVPRVWSTIFDHIEYSMNVQSYPVYRGITARGWSISVMQPDVDSDRQRVKRTHRSHTKNTVAPPYFSQMQEGDSYNDELPTSREDDVNPMWGFGVGNQEYSDSVAESAQSDTGANVKRIKSSKKRALEFKTKHDRRWRKRQKKRKERRKRRKEQKRLEKLLQMFPSVEEYDVLGETATPANTPALPLREKSNYIRPPESDDSVIKPYQHVISPIDYVEPTVTGPSRNHISPTSVLASHADSSMLASDVRHHVSPTSSTPTKAHTPVESRVHITASPVPTSESSTQSSTPSTMQSSSSSSSTSQSASSTTSSSSPITDPPNRINNNPPSFTFNYGPIVLNGINRLEAEVGDVLDYQIPKNTFYDHEDGDASKLSLRLLTDEGEAMVSTSWIKFNKQTRVLYALPLPEHVGTHTFILSATDSGGKSVYEMFEIVIRHRSNQWHINHEFSLSLDLEYQRFLQDVDQRVDVTNKLARLYGDDDPRHIRVTRVRHGSVVLSWTNKTVHSAKCPLVEITGLVKQFMDTNSSASARLVDAMFPYKVLMVEATCKGSCKIDLEEGERPVNDVPFRSSGDFSVESHSFSETDADIDTTNSNTWYAIVELFMICFAVLFSAAVMLALLDLVTRRLRRRSVTDKEITNT